MRQLNMREFAETKNNSSKLEKISKNKDCDEMVFEIPLEYGEADRYGEREATHRVTFNKGVCFIDGKEVRFAEAGVEVIKYGMQDSLNEEQKKVLGIDKLLAKKEKK